MSDTTPLHREEFVDPPAGGTYSIFRMRDNVTEEQTSGPSDNPFDSVPIQVLNEYVSSDDVGGKNVWKNFQHYKAVLVPNPHFPPWYPTGQFVTDLGNSEHLWHKVVLSNPRFRCYGFGEETGDMPLVGLPPYIDLSAGDGFIPTPSNKSALIAASLRTMLPLVKSELSLVNSILELKDFKSLPHTIAHIYEFLKAGAKTLRSFLRAGSDGYLQAKFNILPLLSDIAGIHRALIQTEARINGFISSAGKTQKRHFTFSMAETSLNEQESGPYDIGGPTVLPSSNGFPSFTQRLTTPDLSTFHAEIQYNYNYTGYQIEHAQCLALMDAMGLNLNPVIIWNAIPWSFVVDWVLGVNQFLNGLRVGNMDPVINIQRYLWSIRRSRTIALSHTFCRQTTYPWIPVLERVPSSVIRETAYKRVIELPDTSSLVESGLSLDEFSLGAALVFARRGPRHPRKWSVPKRK
jgi:hypothetical protein